MDAKETQAEEASEQQRSISLQKEEDKEGSAAGVVLPKTEWPEVVGLTPQEAETHIKAEAPGNGIHIHVVPPQSFVTCDFRSDRVRIYTDSSGKVSRPPTIG